MVWGGFSFHETTQLAIISTHQDSTEYQKHLQDNLQGTSVTIKKGFDIAFG